MEIRFEAAVPQFTVRGVVRTATDWCSPSANR